MQGARKESLALTFKMERGHTEKDVHAYNKESDERNQINAVNVQYVVVIVYHLHQGNLS